MAEACEEWCGHVQNEHRKGEARIQPLADDVYASDRVLRPTVVVPAAICHDAVVVWDRRMLGGEEYMATAFGVQLELAQWMGELPRLRVAVLTFNVQCPSGSLRPLRCRLFLAVSSSWLASGIVNFPWVLPPAK